MKLVGFAVLILTPLIAVAQTYNANSQLGNGIVNAGGQWAGQIGGVGANANRNAANQLFQQSLQHEAQGFASFPPNFALLAQSLTEAQQGFKANDQARQLGQTSLQAVQTANRGGNVDLSQYGTSQSQLLDLANNSSPYAAQVQSEMGKYGFSVSHDGSVIQTPFGKFSGDSGPEEMAANIGKGAKYFGADAQSLANSVKSALTESEAIAQKALAAAQAAAKGGAGSAATAATDKVQDEKSSAAGGKALGRGPASTGPLSAKLNGQGYDMTANQLELAKSREEMRRKLGLNSDTIGERKDDIFAVVHEQYQTMRARNQFNLPEGFLAVGTGAGAAR